MAIKYHIHTAWWCGDPGQFYIKQLLFLNVCVIIFWRKCILQVFLIQQFVVLWPVHSFTQISPQYWMFLLESISFKFLISLIMTVLMVLCPCCLWWRVLSGLNSRGPQVIHIYTHDIIVNLYWYILMDWGTQENSLPASLSLWKC